MVLSASIVVRDGLLAAKPWRSAFILERALPFCVRGPVLLAAFFRLAAICFSDAILVLYGFAAPPVAWAAVAASFSARAAQRFSRLLRNDSKRFCADAIKRSIATMSGNASANVAASIE